MKVFWPYSISCGWMSELLDLEILPVKTYNIVVQSRNRRIGIWISASCQAYDQFMEPVAEPGGYCHCSTSYIEFWANQRNQSRTALRDFAPPGFLC